MGFKWRKKCIINVFEKSSDAYDSVWQRRPVDVIYAATAFKHENFGWRPFWKRYYRNALISIYIYMLAVPSSTTPAQHVSGRILRLWSNFYDHCESKLRPGEIVDASRRGWLEKDDVERGEAEKKVGVAEREREREEEDVAP
uniref:Mitochondrial import inner membrane translocase subunit Tim17/Tim22/Tim23 family protein n=1 Tax=Syphacia muris TaxID=451379 RepID=A0A0N5AS20_9BILA